MVKEIVNLKFVGGKYYLVNEDYFIDMYLLVNNAFQDGYHIDLFFNNLQKKIKWVWKR